ncbi:MAG TPA: cobyric acid synthase [Lacisediminihabitans sp.]|uniref:type 1 glutamine amidotransferase n=1 Tax=Lacisediminihabitans sp. TaxID=2787631 RepID=UPI002ED885ED
MSDLTLLELYPGHLMMNGDMGNAAVLKRRAELAGLGLTIVGHDPGDALPDSVDVVSIGTGPTSAQVVVTEDLVVIAARLREWAAGGLPIIAVNAGFHLLGRSLTLPDGTVLEGAGLFPVTTLPRAERTVTDAFVVDTTLAGRMIGIENQAVAVSLHDGTTPLGDVVTGRGNDGRVEGARVLEAFGTHLHGPVLALNPSFADHLLRVAAERAGLVYRTTDAHSRIDAVAREARGILAKAAGIPLDRPE